MHPASHCLNSSMAQAPPPSPAFRSSVRCHEHAVRWATARRVLLLLFYAHACFLLHLYLLIWLLSTLASPTLSHGPSFCSSARYLDGWVRIRSRAKHDAVFGPAHVSVYHRLTAREDTGDWTSSRYFPFPARFPWNDKRAQERAARRGDVS
jgi:hypothetical protein